MPSTFTDFIDKVKVKGMIPTSQNTFTTQRFLDISNDIMRLEIVPMIVRVRESYYSYVVDTTFNATGIYDIPSRAIAGKLLNLYILNGTAKLNLPWVFEEELQDYGTSPVGRPTAFVRGNQVYLLPVTPPQFTTLRMMIHLRPNEIVANASAAQITAINTGTNTLTFATSTIPTTYTTGVLYDLIQQKPPFGTLALDQGVSSVTSTTVVFSSTLPSSLAVGDWLSLAGQTPIIQMPIEVQTLFVQLVANQCLKNSPHVASYQAGVADAKSLMDNAVGLLDHRIENAGRKVVNRTGILRRGL